jgi:hypothetical protein
VYDKGYSGTLLTTTIETLAMHYGVIGPDEFAAGRPLRGFGEEIASFDYTAESVAPTLRGIVAALLHDRPNAAPKLIQTRALEDAGYRKGDIAIVEQGLAPVPGDVVVAQVYDDERGGAQTVLRVYRRAAGSIGFLMPPAGEDNAEPLLVDGKAVRIAGVVTQSLRPNARRTAA